MWSYSHCTDHHLRPQTQMQLNLLVRLAMEFRQASHWTHQHQELLARETIRAKRADGAWAAAMGLSGQNPSQWQALFPGVYCSWSVWEFGDKYWGRGKWQWDSRQRDSLCIQNGNFIQVVNKWRERERESSVWLWAWEPVNRYSIWDWQRLEFLDRLNFSPFFIFFPLIFLCWLHFISIFWIFTYLSLTPLKIWI